MSTTSISSKPYHPYVLESNIACEQGAVRRVRYTHTGTYMLTCGVDKTIKLWNPQRKLLLKSYVGHGYEVCDARGSDDNAAVCSGSVDKSVFLWDVATGKALRRFTGHLGAVNTVIFNPGTCDIIVSGSLDGRVRCWDARSRGRDPVQEMDDAKDSVVSLHVTDHEILSGSLDGYVRRYDMRNSSLSDDLMPTSITCATFSNDGACLLISALDSTLRLLDKTDGALLASYTGGHKCSDYAVECTPTHNDQYVMCGSEDGRVAVYDLLSGDILQQLQHPQPFRSAVIQSLSHHPKEPELLTASEGKVYLWTAPKQPNSSPAVAPARSLA